MCDAAFKFEYTYLTRQQKRENPLMKELIVIAFFRSTTVSKYIMLSAVPMEIHV